MLWLFGQIWLWMLLSFALGAGVTALVMRRTPARPEPVYEEQAEAEYVPGPPPNPYLLDDGVGEYPPRAPTAWPPDDDRPEPAHLEGELPSVEWPPEREADTPVEEPAWPSAEDWPPADHRPGRSR